MSSRRMFLVVLQLLGAAGLVQPAPTGEAVSSPVKKVVILLEEMKAQVEKEGSEDDKAYEKYMCWCDTNEKEKLAAIENAETRIEELGAFLEGAAAKEAELKTQIEMLEHDIAEDRDALDTATAVRQRENKEFVQEEADMKEVRGGLHEAIQVLSKVQLLQGHTLPPQARAALVQVRNVVEKRFPQYHSVMQRDLFDVLSSLQDVKQHETGAFLEQSRLLPWEKTEQQIGKEANPNDLQGQAAGAKSYNARSGVILGVLDQMHDEFSRDLGAAQKAELQALIQFNQLRAAKLGEIAAGIKQREEAEATLADLLDKVATSKEDLAALQDAMAADQEFLANLKKNCKSEDAEHTSRVNMRVEEIRAITETLRILTDDESRELFGKTPLFGKTLSFIQTGSSSAIERAQDHNAELAMQRLAVTARQHRNWALASLAVRVRLDAFTKVKVLMDKMIEELRKAQKEEYEKWEFCQKEIDSTEDTIKVGEYTKEDLDKKHRELVNQLEVLNNDIAELNSQIHDMEVNLKQAGEARKEENLLFQQSVSDQRATIDILQKAAARLKMFYQKKGALVQVGQVPGAPAPPPPPKGKDYSKSAGAGGVLQMLAMIISDAGRTEKELEVSEQHAQTDYAEFANNIKASVEANRDLITEKKRQVATTEAEKSETEEAQLANDQSQEKLRELLAAHHTNCDFLLKYFKVRQQARAEEIDSIVEAKAILSGADFK